MKTVVKGGAVKTTVAADRAHAGLLKTRLATLQAFTPAPITIRVIILAHDT